jgi:hypothetical protein
MEMVQRVEEGRGGREVVEEKRLVQYIPIDSITIKLNEYSHGQPTHPIHSHSTALSPSSPSPYQHLTRPH